MAQWSFFRASALYKLRLTAPISRVKLFSHTTHPTVTKAPIRYSSITARKIHSARMPIHQRTVSKPSLAALGEGCYDTANQAHIRKYLGSHGLIPPAVESYGIQKRRCLAQLALKPSSLAKFEYLSALRKNNVHVFYRLLLDHLKDLTPLIYTPVVGEACRRWSEIYQQPEGMYISYADKGNIAAVLDNWPHANAEITVITDGGRILGLGDLGINGMGIPIGKLALYTACSGIRPDATLPITVDLGTNNEKLRNEPLYLGSRRERVSLEEETEFLDELMRALTEKWPGIVIQFEDVTNPTSSLERYRRDYPCFNDDVQGTGAVILGGLMQAVKRSGVPVKDHKAVIFGAGSSGIGVTEQICGYFQREGLSENDARASFWLVDSKGLVTDDRGDTIPDYKKKYSRSDNQGRQFKNLEEVIDHVRPTMLIGLSTVGGVFTPSIIGKLSNWNDHPIIFPLSNPSANSECDFETAIKYSDGRVLFASGSPFPSYTHTSKQTGESRVYHPGQGNNMYVFPGIGLGAVLCKAVEVTDSMLYAAAAALSESLTAEEKERSLLYPGVTRIRTVSIRVAMGVIRAAQEAKVDRETSIKDANDAELKRWLEERMYDPYSENYTLAETVEKMLGSYCQPEKEEV